MFVSQMNWLPSRGGSLNGKIRTFDHEADHLDQDASKRKATKHIRDIDLRLVSAPEQLANTFLTPIEKTENLLTADSTQRAASHRRIKVRERQTKVPKRELRIGHVVQRAIRVITDAIQRRLGTAAVIGIQLKMQALGLFNICWKLPSRVELLGIIGIAVGIMHAPLWAAPVGPLQRCAVTTISTGREISRSAVHACWKIRSVISVKPFRIWIK